ncbi:CDP-glycerol glycerophosphotransferase family protein [Paenibacillus sp. 2RAB27]|uniref:CDP-glycerol glycerophosphotransferase family protein n=1 Tax=Paenibacillus sp. 2RAB27 TaxID=3232991 RepID=UPI003F98A53D
MYKLIARLKILTSFAIIYFFNLFPIRKNKILLFSYYGSQFGCSPKYITEYIVSNFPKDKFDVVWAFNDIKSKQHLIGFRKVRIMSLRYFYDLCTSKVIITNYRSTDLFVKRKDQYYIQTWHSSLRLKHIEKDAEDVLPEHYVEMAIKDSLKCDLLLSGCKLSTEIFQRSFWYNGEIFEYGTPRNDMFFRRGVGLRDDIFKRLNISIQTKVILYAPTFRKDHSLEIYNLDYDEILKSLNQRFGGEWIFLVKLHPHLISKSSELPFGIQVKNVTDYDDIQELLNISDVLITDYSSLMFDFSNTRRPCFLYVPDSDDYIKNERKLYFDLKELPFINTINNTDLLHKIETFSDEAYQSNLQEFLAQIGSFEEGNACERLLKRIEEVCNRKGRFIHEAV